MPALNKLSKHSKITFKGADNGGDLVCMNRADYEYKTNTTAYRKIPIDSSN